MFQLEALLNLRRREERDRQIALAQVDRERALLEDRLRQQQKNLSVGKSDLRSSLIGPLDLAVLRQQAANATQVNRAARRIVLELAGVHRRIETAREALIEAARRRRALELLRERRFEQYKRRLARIEDAQMDELATIASGRRTGRLEA